MDEANDEVVGDGVGVLGVGGEVVVGGVEGDGEEGDGGVWWERGFEFCDVEGGVDYGDGVVSCLF